MSAFLAVIRAHQWLKRFNFGLKQQKPVGEEAETTDDMIVCATVAAAKQHMECRRMNGRDAVSNMEKFC